MSSRLQDWEDRLAAFVADHRARPFEWGAWDCALYAVSCADELTGGSNAAAYLGRYSDRAGSALALREIGKGTLLRTLDGLYKRKPAAFAQRGDLVWIKGAVGVCMGAVGLFVAEERAEGAEAGREGLIAFPRALFEKAWAV